MSSVAVLFDPHALHWGLSKSASSSLWMSVPRRAARSARSKDRQPAEAARQWISRADDMSSSIPDALAGLSWAYFVAESAALLPDELRSELIAKLEQQAAEATRLSPSASPLIHQLSAVELVWPLRLADAAPWALDPAARRTQSAALGDLLAGSLTWWLDAEATPLPAALPHAPLLLASLLRCARWWRASELPGWSDNLAARLESLTQAVIRLARSTGAPMFSDSSLVGESTELLSAALEECTHVETRILATTAELLEIPKRSPAHDQPTRSEYSDAAGLATMRSDWTQFATRVGCSFADTQARAELDSQGRPLLEGLWQAHVAIDGRPLEPISPWTETLWFTDDDVDYLEWSMDLSEGWNLQRQFLLCRESKWVFVADAVLGDRSARIDYRLEWPLAEGVRGEAAAETHEWKLMGRTRPLACVLPLAFPEWRAAPWPGELRAADGVLAASTSQTGDSLYMPLLLATDRKQLNRPLTWRRLTIAENLEIVPRDMAAGYRVQFGARHWLFYQALSRKGNRSLLGQNVAGWFYAAEIKKDGSANPLVRIDE